MSSIRDVQHTAGVYHIFGTKLENSRDVGLDQFNMDESHQGFIQIMNDSQQYAVEPSLTERQHYDRRYPGGSDLIETP